MAEVPVLREQRVFERFLSHLVFQNQGLKVGLELSFCLFLHTAISNLVPWEALGIPLSSGALSSWFLSCVFIIAFDQLVLSRSAYILRKAYLHSLSGDYETAISLYESIGPFGNALVKIPNDIYHLHRSELLTRCGDYYLAEREFSLAEEAQAEPSHLAILKSRYWLARENEDEASVVLETAKELVGDSQALLLEEGRQLLDKKSELWRAKDLFREVLKMPSIAHFSGESTHQLALAYISVARLWTGEAEVGIEQLSDSINRFQSQTGFVDTLRPLLAEFLSYRAHYYATHSHPKEGVLDLKVALSLCNHRQVLDKVELIKEELSWRHGIELS